MNMIAKVAEAIRLKSCERGYPVHPNVAHHLAAAAIEAMREPTPSMHRAGEMCCMDNCTDRDGVKKVWRAMLLSAAGQSTQSKED